MKRISFYIVLVLTLILPATGGAHASANTVELPEAETDSYLLTISEISGQHELPAPAESEADEVILYELPAGAVISLTAKADGISHEIVCYNEQNRKIESFFMSKDGYGKGDKKELEVGAAVSYTITDKDMAYTFMSIDVTQENKTTSFFFCVVEAPEPEVSEEPEIELIATAVPASSQVLINGSKKSLLAYTINGYNYFKLRDIAAVLNGSEKQFGVAWDSDADSISLTTGEAYILESEDLQAGVSQRSETGLATRSQIFLDEKEVSFVAYNIRGNNYFKLRDLGKALNFGVDWDPVTKSILIDSGKEYTE